MKKISTLLKKISNKLSKVFYFDSYNPTGFGFTANQYRKLDRSITNRPGYTPIIVQVTCNTHSAIRVFHWYLDGNTLYYEAINMSSSSVSGVGFAIKVLYLKTELGG